MTSLCLISTASNSDLTIKGEGRCRNKHYFSVEIKTALIVISKVPFRTLNKETDYLLPCFAKDVITYLHIAMSMGLFSMYVYRHACSTTTLSPRPPTIKSTRAVLAWQRLRPTLYRNVPTSSHCRDIFQIELTVYLKPIDNLSKETRLISNSHHLSM